MFFISKVPQAAKVLGMETYLLGGFVLDKLLGRDSKDADFVCVGDGIALAQAVAQKIVLQLLERELLEPASTAFISPYSGQVAAAKEALPRQIRVSTIDSFQGQEKENIILSLVRSNDDGDIGFLKDYRRMNVAITRAKEKLFIIGDSATIGADKFYHEFLSYIEQHGSYRTVWEFEM